MELRRKTPQLSEAEKVELAGDLFQRVSTRYDSDIPRQALGIALALHKYPGLPFSDFAVSLANSEPALISLKQTAEHMHERIRRQMERRLRRKLQDGEGPPAVVTTTRISELAQTAFTYAGYFVHMRKRVIGKELRTRTNPYENSRKRRLGELRHMAQRPIRYRRIGSLFHRLAA